MQSTSQIKISILDPSSRQIWDDYVLNHPQSTLYHLFGWSEVINKTYGHKAKYLIATDNFGSVKGILPLVNIKSIFFGNTLISIPFFDLGGVIADSDEAAKALIDEAVMLGKKLKVDKLELRHQEPLKIFDNDSLHSVPCFLPESTRSHKVRMILELPESSDLLMSSFKSKLRSQIKKPIKEGLIARMGGVELLDEFYKVFLVNMRDLGSPVHSRTLLNNVLNFFTDSAKIFIVEHNQKPLACSMTVGFKNILENPWASSLKQYSRLSPNMLLYWTMLEYACNEGFKYFDFGRSTPDQGTNRFKQQWGARPEPIYWQSIYLKGMPVNENAVEKSKFSRAIQYWQKLPVPVTKILGPMIRKNISL